MFDKNLLFLSAFGKACNMAVRGGTDGAVDDKFDRAVIDNAIAPWCSATPLSGELLQVSLDALLQNDINLLSAYPDAYVSQSYDGTKAHNGEQFCYFPAGDGQGIETGEDTWNNSVTLSATIGSITGPNNETSGVVLGSLVPAYPFQHGKEWNYGVFGVSSGAPTWYNINVSALDNFDMMAAQSAINGYSATSAKIFDTRTVSNYGVLWPDSNVSVSAWMWEGINQNPDGQSALKILYENAEDCIPMVYGSFKRGDVLELNYRINVATILAKTSTGTGVSYLIDPNQGIGAMDATIADKQAFQVELREDFELYAAVFSAKDDKLDICKAGYTSKINMGTYNGSLCGFPHDKAGNINYAFSGFEGDGQAVIRFNENMNNCTVGVMRRLKPGKTSTASFRYWAGTYYDVGPASKNAYIQNGNADYGFFAEAKLIRGDGVKHTTPNGAWLNGVIDFTN